MLDLFLPKITRIYGPTIDSRLTAKEQAKKEKKRLYMQAYHAKNKAKRLAAMKARYEVKKPEYIAKARKWHKANPEKTRAMKRRSDALHQNTRLRLDATGSSNDAG